MSVRRDEDDQRAWPDPESATRTAESGDVPDPTGPEDDGTPDAVDLDEVLGPDGPPLNGDEEAEGLGPEEPLPADVATDWGLSLDVDETMSPAHLAEGLEESAPSLGQGWDAVVDLEDPADGDETGDWTVDTEPDTSLEGLSDGIADGPEDEAAEDEAEGFQGDDDGLDDLDDGAFGSVADDAGEEGFEEGDAVLSVIPELPAPEADALDDEAGEEGLPDDDAWPDAGDRMRDA